MDLGIYVQDILNTTMMVVLQVLCHYEFMIEMGPIMLRNRLYMSLSCIASTLLPRLGEGALQREIELEMSFKVLEGSFYRLTLNEESNERY